MRADRALPRAADYARARPDRRPLDRQPRGAEAIPDGDAGELPHRHHQAHRLRLWTGSGGAGRFRGGLGLEKMFEATTTDVTVSHRGERFASSPWPLDGSGPGARAHAFILRKDGTREDLSSKKMIVLQPGDQLWEYIAGGAGYGDPLERDPAAVLADVLDGKIANAAEYGVVLTADGRAVDEVKTKEGREGLAGRRTGGGGDSAPGTESGALTGHFGLLDLG